MEWLRGWFRCCMQRVVQAGPVPKHAAFIMDGNRRFADKRHISRGSGHTAGYKKVTGPESRGLLIPHRNSILRERLARSHG
jgi:hypothetical protein